FALASHWISWIQWFIPIIYPIQSLLGRGNHLSLVAYVFSLVLWLVLAVTLGSYLLRSARKQGLGRRF
ncbi:multidrug ABC transporter permease, partial [Streptococcus pasteurianus]|nr:multidrug ABC transporter permease [Streptococcus pasteurianus]